MKLKLALTALPFLFGCAAQEALMTDTPSGYPEATFENSTLQNVQNKLIGVCSRIGAAVSDTNANMVVCGKTMEGQSAVFAQLLLGNAYSTPPVDKMRFVLDSNGSSVHVTAYEWVETVMPFGQVKQAELRSNNARNSMQRVLDRLNGTDYQRSAHTSTPSAPYVVDPKDSIIGTGAVGETFPVNKSCVSYSKSGGASLGALKVKEHEPGETLKIYARSGLYARISPDGTQEEWILYGICS